MVPVSTWEPSQQGGTSEIIRQKILPRDRSIASRQASDTDAHSTFVRAPRIRIHEQRCQAPGNDRPPHPNRCKGGGCWCASDGHDFQRLMNEKHWTREFVAALWHNAVSRASQSCTTDSSNRSRFRCLYVPWTLCLLINPSAVALLSLRTAMRKCGSYRRPPETV